MLYRILRQFFCIRSDILFVGDATNANDLSGCVIGNQLVY